MNKYKKPKLDNTTTTEAKIIRLSHDGRGVATINGKTTFLAGGLNGETVAFHYQQQHRRFDEGQVHAVIDQAHPARCEPQCVHFGICGGCQLQHLNHAAQLQHKQAMLLELLQQQGLTVKQLLPPLIGDIWGYRRKARLCVKYTADNAKVTLGFYQEMSHVVADISTCPILIPNISNKLEQLSTTLTALKSRSAIAHIEIAVADNTTALIFRHLQPLSPSDLQTLIQFGKQQHFSLFLQPAGPESVVPIDSHQNQLLYYSLNAYHLKLHFTPAQFIQVNALVNQQMVAQALQLLSLQPQDKVLDLFCGIGNFSLAMATQATSVVGIEGEKSAVAMAQYNADNNNISNCKFYCADLTTPPDSYNWVRQTYDKIVLDPPRTGAAVICSHIKQWKAQSIIYISCNPITLARDACILKAQGYQLRTLGAIDMFPHTKHIEAMALFQRK